MRFVIVDDVPTRDDRRRLPGRGAWAHEACLEQAERRGALRRSLRAKNMSR
ncbi:MAG: YlxR family protein [Propionibacteriaceae bacterium]|nr:YlxR family protein [Propionibacteriaceae bacterium]